MSQDLVPLGWTVLQFKYSIPIVVYIKCFLFLVHFPTLTSCGSIDTHHVGSILQYHRLPAVHIVINVRISLFNLSSVRVTETETFFTDFLSFYSLSIWKHSWRALQPLSNFFFLLKKERNCISLSNWHIHIR